LILFAPSSSEYSLWTCRWATGGAALVIEVIFAIGPDATAPPASRFAQCADTLGA
jgi:hypothetical protein